MLELKADTSVKVVIGPVVAVGDGFTPVTTLALTTADEAEIMKHDAAAVLDISTYTFAAIASMDGYYNLTLPAGAVDTEGMLVVGINDDSLCLPVRNEFHVVDAGYYDKKYGGNPSGVKKNSQLASFVFFMVDSGDDVSGKTGLTVTAERSIDGAAFAACANAVTEIANGYYKITLAAADLNGDVIALKFTATGANTTAITILTEP